MLDAVVGLQQHNVFDSALCVIMTIAANSVHVKYRLGLWLAS